MVPLRLERPHADPTNDAAISAEATAFVQVVRLAAMACRVKPRADLFEACALLHVSKAKSSAAHAEALVLCLREALGKPARFFAPGEREMTFDESWLAQLAMSFLRGDQSSHRFLLGSRVARENRRLVSFLVGQIVEHISKN